MMTAGPAGGNSHHQQRACCSNQYETRGAVREYIIIIIMYYTLLRRSSNSNYLIIIIACKTVEPNASCFYHRYLSAASRFPANARSEFRRIRHQYGGDRCPAMVIENKSYGWIITSYPAVVL